MKSKPGLSPVLMGIGAVCFFGGIIAAAVGSTGAGVALIVVGAVLALVAWAVLIISARGYRKDVRHMQADQQQRLEQAAQDAWRASGAAEAMRKHPQDD